MTRKIYTGKVISDKNDKTIVVLVKRKYVHPFFKKVMSVSKKYHTHDKENKFKIGNTVNIVECRPISKKKKYEVVYK